MSKPSKPDLEDGSEKRINRLAVKINAALITAVVLLASLVGVAVFLGLQIHFCGKENTGNVEVVTNSSMTKYNNAYNSCLNSQI